MKNSFEFTLKGKDWWKPFLGFWAFYILYLIASALASNPETQGWLTTIFSLVVLLGFLVIYPIFTIIFLRIIMPRLSIGGKSFAFRGSIGRFLGINIGGFFLSIITLTIYLPWYVRRATSYLVSETTFGAFAPEFLGKGGRLLVYMLLALWIPVAVVIGLITLVGSSVWAASVMMLLLYIVIIPFYYLMYKWFVNIRWNEVTIAWETTFLSSYGYILGQFLLTVVTLGIYWPAAYLRIYGYFTERTVFTRDGKEIGRLVFEGDIRKGFGLLWGQTLLIIITLGIYTPWAYSNIGCWMASATFFESNQTGQVSA